MVHISHFAFITAVELVLKPIQYKIKAGHMPPSSSLSNKNWFKVHVLIHRIK